MIWSFFGAQILQVSSMDEDILRKWVVLISTNDSTLEHGLQGIDSEISDLKNTHNM